MEELFAYAYLMIASPDFDALYEEKLHKLFLDCPDNDDLLHLESLCGDVKETLIYISMHVNYHLINIEKFGGHLMNLLKPIYETVDITKFASSLYNIWQLLWGGITNQEPFFIMNYAEDHLSYGDEKEARELCENMLSFYDK